MYRGFSIAVIGGQWVGVDHQREFVRGSKEALFEAIDTALA
jgi:hypothetical protein